MGRSMLLFVLLASLACGFAFWRAYELRTEALRRENADAMTSCDGTRMKVADCHIQVLIPQSRPALLAALVKLPTLLLMAIVYASAGLAGTCAHFVVAIGTEGTAALNGGDPAFRLLGGAIFGAVMLLVLILSAQGLALFPALAGLEDWGSFDLLILLPFLAGLFTSIFHRSLRNAFERILSSDT